MASPYYTDPMRKVVVLGSQGMLGNEVCRTLSLSGFETIGTQRIHSKDSDKSLFQFDGTQASVNEFFYRYKDIDYVVNCVGKIWQKTEPTTNFREFINVNTLLPYFLNNAAKDFGFKVIQIATDCVYSGLGFTPNHLIMTLMMSMALQKA